MTDLAAVTALTINGRSLSLHDVLHGLKVAGSQGFLEQAVNDHLLAEAAIEENIDVSDEELQDAVNRFRQRAGLNSADATAVWLKQNRLTVDDLANRLEQRLIQEKLKQKITEGQEERYFENNRESFETAVIGQISFSEESAAEDFLRQCKDGGSYYYALIREQEQGLLDGRPRAYPVPFRRDDLTPTIEAAVFGAAAGDVIGPLHSGLSYHVIKVEELRKAELTGSLKAKIRETLFDDWCKDLLHRAKIEVELTDVI